MDDTQNTPMTLDRLADAYEKIENQFNDAQVQFTGLHNELNLTKNTLKLSNQIQVPY